MKEFKRIRVIDQDLNAVQTNIQEYVEPLTDNPILDGVLIQNITLTAGTSTPVKHKLGRKPLGWVVVRKRAESTVWDTQDNNELPTLTLELDCSANVTVDLWIF